MHKSMIECRFDSNLCSLDQHYDKPAPPDGIAYDVFNYQLYPHVNQCEGTCLVAPCMHRCNSIDDLAVPFFVAADKR